MTPQEIEKLAEDWAYENHDRHFRCSQLSCGGGGTEKTAQEAFKAGAREQAAIDAAERQDLVNVVVKKDANIAALESQLAEKQAAINSYTLTIDDADKRRHALESQLSTLKAEADRMREICAEASDRLKKIAYQPLTDDFEYCYRKELFINSMEAIEAREILSILARAKGGT